MRPDAVGPHSRRSGVSVGTSSCERPVPTAALSTAGRFLCVQACPVCVPLLGYKHPPIWPLSQTMQIDWQIPQPPPNLPTHTHTHTPPVLLPPYHKPLGQGSHRLTADLVCLMPSLSQVVLDVPLQMLLSESETSSMTNIQLCNLNRSKSTSVTDSEMLIFSKPTSHF